MSEPPSFPASSVGTSNAFPLTPQERGWLHRRYSILRNVLGPDFHGPSSSHTAAPQLIALEVYAMLGGVPDRSVIELVNSFATTGDGHKTPIAVTAGLLGFATTDPRTRDAQMLAADQGYHFIFERRIDPHAHANTLVIDAVRGEVRARVTGISIGGGNFEITDRQRDIALAA